MASPLETVNVLLSVAGILSVWAVWSFGLKPSLTNSFRQRIFEIRDEMFFYAADGNIDFNHPAYGTVRTLMNGYIRFAHRIEFLPMLFLFLLKRKQIKKESGDFANKLNGAIQSLDSDVQKTMKNYTERTAVEAAKYVLWTSPPLMAMAIPFIIILFVVALAFKMLGSFAKLSEFLQAQTENFRLLDHIAFSEAKRRSV